MNDDRFKKIAAKVRSMNYFRYLFLLACLTCASIGWTSAKYTSDIYASSDSARSAEFSYTIKNNAYIIDENGNEKSPGTSLTNWESIKEINLFSLDQSKNEKMKVVFDIELQTEATVKLDMIKTIEGTMQPLKVDRVQLNVDGNLVSYIDDPETPNRASMLSYSIEPSENKHIIQWTVILSHTGSSGHPRNDLNLIPVAAQVD